MSLISFYLNQSPDDAGRRLSDIWAFSLDELEFHHDYIQWLFPLETPSAFNPDAPLLDPPTIKAFRTTPQIQSNLQKSLDVMLNFYGLAHSRDAVIPAKNFSERSKNWLSPNNHNHLRFTRILHCFTLCGRETDARALLTCLTQIAAQNPEAVTPRTLTFWQNALNPS